MAEPTTKQLLEKLSGKRVLVSSRCGTFQQTDGIIQQVFADFFLFLINDDRRQDEPPSRNWIWISNLGVVTEAPKVSPEELEIER